MRQLCEQAGGARDDRGVPRAGAPAAARGRRGPGTAEDLRRLLAGEVDIRIVDGEGHRNAAKADADLRWADVVAVWSSTILSHKVSKLYTDRRDAFGDKLVTVPRRGVAALCMAVIEKVGLTTG
ncbi:hypothetical protein [Sorangium cellulosum]|uniref:hypothetical protein n=1 Tax=Sorangium cellulosum TaxID=56 RepID=UPI001F36C4F9|nr:hypothetical protein [Sorangium cellulosum]